MTYTPTVLSNWLHLCYLSTSVYSRCMCCSSPWSLLMNTASQFTRVFSPVWLSCLCLQSQLLLAIVTHSSAYFLGLNLSLNRQLKALKYGGCRESSSDGLIGRKYDNYIYFIAMILNTLNWLTSIRILNINILYYLILLFFWLYSFTKVESIVQTNKIIIFIVYEFNILLDSVILLENIFC